MKRGFNKLSPGGCPGCQRGHTTIDLRPEGWMCETHGPLAERQIVSMDDVVHCLACLREALENQVFPVLEKRKLDWKEFEGYNLGDGRFTKRREPDTIAG